jgi:hypothetical protein
MRKKVTVLLLLLGALWGAFLVQQHGQYKSNPPVSSTGAPGEGSCANSTCHSVTPDLGRGQVAIQVMGDTVNYTPDSIYPLEVHVNNPYQSVYGFELTALNENNNGTGSLLRTDSLNTTLQSSGGRQYIGHNSADTVNTWSFKWQAPSSYEGDITFYAAGNAANGDGGPGGDSIYTSSLTLVAVRASFTATPDTVTPGETVTFQNNSTPSDSFRWNFGDGQMHFTRQDTSITHQYSKPDTLFKPTLTAYRGNVQDKSTPQPIVVTDTTSGNEDTTARPRVKPSPSLQLYPNPATETITITELSPSYTGGRLYFYNKSGQVVLSKILPKRDNKATYSLPPLAKGIYIVELQHNHRLWRTKLLYSGNR